MILGSHHENLLHFDDNENNKNIGFNNFPANKSIKNNYDSNRICEQKHIYLKANVDFENDTFSATCYILFETKFKNIKTFQLNSCESLIREVAYSSFNGENYNSKNKKIGLSHKLFEDAKYEKCDFHNGNSLLDILLPEKVNHNSWFIIKINYKIIEPKAGFYFVHAKQKSHANYNCVWTQGQDTDSPYWFPRQDDTRLKVTSSIHISFPKQWNALSNGIKISEKINENQKREFHN